MLSDTDDPSYNQILAALPAEEMEAVLPDLKPMPLSLGQVLQRCGESMDYIYFPLDCVISSIAITEEGKSAEVSVHGREGAQGTEALLGPGIASRDAIVRVPGRALRIRERKLHPLFSRHAVLHARLIRYMLYVVRQVTQAAVCLRGHRLEQRLCRWLLMGSDWEANNVFPMNPDLLSSMLGASRPEVSEAASALRKAKLISYGRGEISILNRGGLEAIVCNCHRLLHAEFVNMCQTRTSRIADPPPGFLDRLPPSAVARNLCDAAPHHQQGKGDERTTESFGGN